MKNIPNPDILVTHKVKKIFLTMKISFLLIILTALNAYSTSIFSQNAKVSVNMQNATVREVVGEIEKQGGINFLFNDNLPGLNQLVNVTFVDQPFKDVLEDALSQADMMYEEINDDFVVLRRNPDNFRQQQVTVTGRVTDAETGEGLPGASIIIKGTAVGVVSDLEGNYELGVPDQDAVLVFSYVGYLSREMAVGDRTTINIELQIDAIGIEEVVSIGYGTARRSEITGSVGIVTERELEEVQSFNIYQSLQGRVAGVSVYSYSGEPGGSSRIIIRGMGTINADEQPLFVIDGVQTTNIDFLNPNDIQSIEILKDASSAAIYGSRGANGVVLITTKRGLAEVGVKVNYRFNAGLGQLARKRNSMYNPMNAQEYMEVLRTSYENAPYFANYPPGQEPVLNLSDDRVFDSNGNPLFDTDWEKEATRTALSHNHQLDILSGSENSSYGIFLNYTDEQGIFLNTYMQRASVKGAYDATPFKWLSVGADLRMNRIWDNNSSGGGGFNSVLRAIYEVPPILPVQWEDGSYTSANQISGIGLVPRPNPIATLMLPEMLTDRTNLWGNLSANFTITPDLEFRTQFGIDNNLVRNRNYGHKDLRGHAGGFPDGLASIAHSTSTFWQNENYLTYSKDFSLSRVNFMLGASWQKQTNQNSSFQVRGFTDDDFYKYNNVNVASRFFPPSSNYTDWSMNSYFGRGTYSYNNKYTATLTARLDGSSRFGENYKYGFFPSAGIAWLISNENFMSEIELIDMLRLRASYGVTGNTEIGLYNSLATIISGTSLIDGRLQSNARFGRIANPDLKWERSYQYDFGFEISAFNYFISVEADYYYKYTSDLLLIRPIPSTTGFSTVMDNIGEVSNQGFDLKLITRNIRTSRFNWISTFTVNYNKNRVEKLGEQDEDIFPGPNHVDGSQTILRVGEPVNSFWGYIRHGVWGTDEAEEAAKVGQLPGMKRYSEEKHIIGKGFPDYRGSFVNRFTIGNFDMMIDLGFSYGADINNNIIHTAEDRNAFHSGMKTQLYQAWTPENQNTMVSMIRHMNLSGQDTRTDSHWVSGGSYLRGSLISVGYTFGNLFNTIDQFRVYINVQNAFVITSKDFKGYDPEVGGWTGMHRFSQNVVYYEYPKPRTTNLGLVINF